MVVRIGDLLGLVVVFAALLMARGALILEQDQESPRGVVVLLPHVCEDRGDARDIFVRYLPNRESYINETSIPEASVPREVADRMSSRYEQVIWFGADETLGYGEVAEMLSKLQVETPHLAILLTTKSQTGSLIPGRVDVSGKTLCPPRLTD